MITRKIDNPEPSLFSHIVYEPMPPTAADCKRYKELIKDIVVTGDRDKFDELRPLFSFIKRDDGGFTEGQQKEKESGGVFSTTFYNILDLSTPGVINNRADALVLIKNMEDTNFFTNDIEGKPNIKAMLASACIGSLRQLSKLMPNVSELNEIDDKAVVFEEEQTIKSIKTTAQEVGKDLDSYCEKKWPTNGFNTHEEYMDFKFEERAKERAKEIIEEEPRAIEASRLAAENKSRQAIKESQEKAKIVGNLRERFLGTSNKTPSPN